MAGHSKRIWLILLLCLNLASTEEKTDSPHTSKDTLGLRDLGSSSALFERLLQLKRSEHKEAVKHIVGIQSMEKQHKLLELVITKIMEVLTKSRITLESSGYLPGSEFPKDENIRDALSSMIENTSFMGDIVLYLPDASKLFLKNNEWSTIFKWSLSLCRESAFLNSGMKKMLHLVAQELNLIEKDPNYLNPYVQANQKRTVQLPETASEKKKVRKKISKGPSLSGSRLKNDL